MTILFNYTIRASFKGYTFIGQEITFNLERTFDAQVEDNHLDPVTAKNVTYINQDFKYHGVREMLADEIKRSAIRYSLDESTITGIRYEVSNQDPDIIVFFHKTNPSNSTTSDKDFIYAYQLVDTKAPSAPELLYIKPDVDSVSFGWNQTGHVHGFYLYRNGAVIETLAADVWEYQIKNLVPNKMQNFQLASFNRYGASKLININTRTTQAPDSYRDRENPEDEETVVYEVVEQESGTLYAFQSGVGDRNDLKIAPRQELAARETFSYTMQIKGYEKKIISVYPEREFEYQFTAYDEEENIIATSFVRLGIVDGALPFKQDGAGKNDLRLPLEVKLPEGAEASRYEVQVLNNSLVYTKFDKGADTYTTYPDDFVTFYTDEKAEKEIEIEVPYYGTKLKGKGSYIAYQDKELIIEEELLNPYNDPALSDAPFERFELIIESDNPNMNVQLWQLPNEMSDRFVPIRLSAKIINPTQTPWTPLIHNGYYYLNQKEYYLYSESQVRSKLTEDMQFLPLSFPYAFHVLGERTVDGEEQVYTDQYLHQFNGTFNGIITSRYAGKLALSPEKNTGSYVSEPKIYDAAMREYYPIQWNADETYGMMRVYTQVKYEDGSWSDWIQETKGEAVKSPLAKELRYKIEMDSGTKELVTNYTREDVTNEQFRLYDKDLSKNIDFVNGSVIMKYPNLGEATFVSRSIPIFEEYNRASQQILYELLSYKYNAPSDSTIKVYTAALPIDSDWNQITWEEVTDVEQIDGLYNGKINSPMMRYLKYKVEFTSTYLYQNESAIFDSLLKFGDGRTKNILITDTGLKPINPTAKGTYISTPISTPNLYMWGQWVLEGANTSVVKMKTFTTDSINEATNISESDPRWVATTSGYEIKSPFKNYTVFMLEFSGDALVSKAGFNYVTYAAYSPAWSGATIHVKKTDYVKESPVLSSISIGGITNDTIENLRYSKSLMSEVIADGELHKLSDKRVAVLRDELFAEQRIDPSGFTITGYELETDNAFGVSLSIRDNALTLLDELSGLPAIENGYVFAESTGVATERVYEELKVEIDANNETIVYPVPEQGAPVVIKDALGNEMIQVAFYNEKGLTLNFTEELQAQGHEFLLSYYFVDSNTIVLEHYNESIKAWETVTSYTQDRNYVQIYPSMPPNGLYRITYRLENSFYVDYNWDAENGYAKIVFHNPQLDASRQVRVSYETNRFSPYYVANEVNLNPLSNLHHSGFLYLADRNESPHKIEVYMNNEELYNNGYDYTIVRASVYDRYHNPVQGVNIQWATTFGRIESITSITDENGITTAKLVAPSRAGQGVVTASVGELKDEHSFEVVTEYIAPRISLETDYPTIYPKDNAVSITAYVYGENQEPVANQLITFSTTSGIISSVSERTNYFGEASIMLAATEIPEVGYIKVTAESEGLQSQDIVVRIDGFRRYDEEYFETTNNFIDVIDRELARRNLGMTAGNFPPSVEEVEPKDLWLDQSDLIYLIQHYNLRDVMDKEESRANLGIHIEGEAPQDMGPNDIWIDKTEPDREGE